MTSWYDKCKNVIPSRILFLIKLSSNLLPDRLCNFFDLTGTNCVALLLKIFRNDLHI